ncbi:DUF4158 domain-containing protein [Streptomyces hygroscopicus]|uniref:DUF4158 domain-containing protein n=1 Tax=Streptomyces hygroscopicus TaxID=1912 RepID=UPI00363DAE5E
MPLWATGRTAERQRTEVRRRVGATYDQAEARRLAEGSIRKEAAAKNRPADLINIALERVVGARLELPAFSALDAMASAVRKEVNTSICTGIHDRMSAVERAGLLRLLRLLEERDADGTTQYNRLKKSAQSPTWSHFKRLIMHLDWVDGLGDRGVDGWCRLAEGHGLRRGGGCGGRLRAQGVRAGQAGRADGVPGAQGEDAGP